MKFFDLNYKKKIFIKIILSILLITYIIYKVDIKAIFNNLISLPNFIILILFFQLCAQSFADVLIKNSMFSIFGNKEKYFILYKKVFKGLFYGFFMPSMIGGDVYYGYHFGKKFKSYPKIISGLFLIKLIGFLVFFTFSIIVLAFYRNKIFSAVSIKGIELGNMFYLIFVVALILIIIIILLKGKKILLRIKDKFIVIKNDILNNKNKLLEILLFTLLFYFISIGGRVIIGKIIGIKLPIGQLAAVIMVVNFLIIIPVSISGIGVREGSYVALMGLFGVDAITALTMSFLDFSITLLGVFLGGIFVLRDNISKKALIVKKKSISRKNEEG